MSEYEGEERRAFPRLSWDEYNDLRELVAKHDQLLEMVEKDAKWKWAATTMRNAAAWIAAILAAILLIWQTFKDVVQGALK